ncbi:hypothetical protein MKZ38_005358 [Zalerion maritima]|uniref:Uncharacterized protein n=1 Tax=Zalerion maritima TaxID=339359 RepID=A0AAD5RY12_9PEZI|nr:hypothetical protein MKZ38_005358 [Zalerion maritima]
MSLAPSSPRLPSPPPAAEIQIGSPSADTAATRQAQAMEQTILDANAKRRIHPGTKAFDMAAGPPIVPLNELDSAFQLQEHLAALHYCHTASNAEPMTRNTSLLLAQAPTNTDRTLWLYELCRFLISQCNTLIVGFLFDTPPCSATTCPEMRASEWQFLCAVHEQPKSCCAIDYCCHTLDWAADVVTNPKLFPSRFVLHNDSHDKGAAVKALINVFRRLHRIFAHAWFQHRGVFWSVETQSGLYVLFKTVCDMYDLLPAENYKLPPEAEGLGESESKRPPAQQRGESGVLPQDDENYNHLNRNTSRRHVRSSPSTGSAVTTVMEADEEEPRKSAPETVEEEPEIAEVPVIVEDNVDAHQGDSSDDGHTGDETVVEVETQPEEASALMPLATEVQDFAEPEKDGRPPEAETPKAEEEDEDEEEDEEGEEEEGSPAPKPADAEKVETKTEPMPESKIEPNAEPETDEEAKTK